ncbi:TetR/AcrR family transcriptional regulator [Kribbella sp. NPDC051620]|uniref:TetR/AcrR family transcriptional regulator n=1 Tax=Kribbella sp. NPDC051620 TaxID=3364120 RepID=UPI0037A36324
MHHGNRHGRSEEARQAVLHAADDLLVEKGFAGLTVEGIATRAGVAKQTIYRWWPSKIEILMEAFVDDAAQYLTPPDTGDLATDLRRHLARLADFLTKTDEGAVFRALAGQAQHDPTVADRLRTDHLTHQRARDRQPLLNAIARGDLPTTTDVDSAVEQLVSPIYYRVLITGEPVPRPYTNHLVTQYLSHA